MAKVTGEGSIIQMEKDKPKSKCRKWQLRAEIDGEFELFEGFFEFAAAGVVRHDCLRCLCFGVLMFALYLGDSKL